jgi:hypothetical protein
VYYTLGASVSFEKHHPTSFQSTGLGHCGTPGLRAGLEFSFMAEDLAELPYNELVEIPFTVSSMGICDSYKDVAVTITASCEMPSPNSHVFQYGVVTDEDGTTVISYDLDNRLYASNSTAMFNVEWASRRRRLMSEDNADMYSKDLSDLGDGLARMEILAFVNMVGLATVLYFVLKKPTPNTNEMERSPVSV